MFFKIILGLALFIVIAALGANSGLGEGFFGFKAKGKAADMVEYTRDVATVMQTYKADDNSNLSVTSKVDNEISGLVDGEGTAGNGLVNYADIRLELSSDNLLKGNGTMDLGAFQAVITDDGAGGEDVLLVNSSVLISDEICDKLNEVFGADNGAEDISADLTGVVSTTDANGNEIPGTVDLATIAVLDAVPFDVLNDGGAEGICVKDNSDTAQNTFAYFVQKH